MRVSEIPRGAIVVDKNPSEEVVNTLLLSPSHAKKDERVIAHLKTSMANEFKPLSEAEFTKSLSDWVNKVYVPPLADAPSDHFPGLRQNYLDQISAAKQQLQNRQVAADRMLSLFKTNDTFDGDKIIGRKLDLSGLELLSLPNCINQINWLTKLDVSGNDLRPLAATIYKNVPTLKFLKIDKRHVHAVQTNTKEYKEFVASETARLTKEKEMRMHHMYAEAPPIFYQHLCQPSKNGVLPKYKFVTTVVGAQKVHQFLRTFFNQVALPHNRKLMGMRPLSSKGVTEARFSEPQQKKVEQQAAKQPVVSTKPVPLVSSPLKTVQNIPASNEIWV